MSTYDETKHPRASDGRFATKTTTEADGGLEALAEKDFSIESSAPHSDRLETLEAQGARHRSITALEFDGMSGGPRVPDGAQDELGLLSMTPGLSRRYRALADSHAFIPAVVLEDDLATHSPGAWWDVQSVTAQFGRGEAAKVPDTVDVADYAGRGYRLRMPAVDQVRAFSTEQNDDSIDIPVSLTHPQGKVSGWVRATRTSATSWSVQPLGMDSDQARVVRASVTAVLESTRPAHTLAQTRSIIDDYRARTTGVGMEPVRSTWVTGVGYDRRTETLVTVVRDQAYAHHVPESVYRQLRDARSPGAVFNQLVKGSERAQITTCPACSRYVAVGTKHTCPDAVNRRTGQAPPDMVRARAAGAIDRANPVPRTR